MPKSKEWKKWKDKDKHPVVPEPRTYGLLFTLTTLIVYFIWRRCAAKNQPKKTS